MNDLVDEQVLQVTVHDQTVVLTLARPNARNALNARLIRALHDPVRDLEAELYDACIDDPARMAALDRCIDDPARMAALDRFAAGDSST